METQGYQSNLKFNFKQFKELFILGESKIV